LQHRFTPRLEPVGKLDLLAGLGAEVERYYSAVAPSDDALGTEALKRRGVAAEVLAEVESAKLDFDLVEALSVTRAEYYERVLTRDPGDVEALLALADAHTKRAVATLAKGDAEGALVRVRRAQDFAEQALNAAPEDRRARIVHAFAQSTLGYILSLRHQDMAGAREAADAALRDVAQVGTGEGLENAWRDLLEGTLLAIRSTEWAATNLAGAREACRRQVALDEVLSRARPADLKKKFLLARAQVYCTEIELQLEIVDDTMIRAAIDSLQSLIPRDPDNRLWRKELPNALIQLCHSYMKRIRDEPARAACREGLAEWRRFRSLGLNDAVTDRSFEYALRVTAQLESKLGHADGAVSLFDEALELDKAELRSGLGSVQIMVSTLSVYYFRADIERQRGRLATAEATARAGIDLATEFPSSVQDAGYVSLWTTNLTQMLADVAVARGDRAAAEVDYRRALDQFARLADRTPGDDEPNRGLSQVAVSLATILLARPGGRAEARGLLQRAVDLLGPMHDKGQLGSDDQELLRRSRHLLGQ
jgi:tetratricopeptide (TPR) repeat protein